MINFRNDYSDIAHPAILEKLMTLKDEKNIGYGLDQHVIKAKSLIQKHFSSEVDIHLMGGGTITNKTVISHLLRPYEAVISADTGHIFVHETGAIEQTGHKIIAVKTESGKLTVELIDQVIKSHTDEHMVKPKMVYISNSTETGFIYSKTELMQLYKYTQANHLYLFVDGARLGVALTSKDNDLTLDFIRECSDCFYIGGTKNGALLGEALVIKDKTLSENFRYSVKQNGGLLAKGFLVGIQFECLFTDNLFFDIGYQANHASNLLKEKLVNAGIDFTPTPTNQQFIKLDNRVVDLLSQSYLFEIWTDYGDTKMIRLVTTYQTTETEINQFISDLTNAI